MLTADIHEFPTAKREISEALRISREAAVLARPFNERVGAWQAETAKLMTMAARLTATGRYDAGVLEMACTLMQSIEAQSVRFEEAVAAQPERVAKHSRVADTRRALEMMTARLRQAMVTLGHRVP